MQWLRKRCPACNMEVLGTKDMWGKVAADCVVWLACNTAALVCDFRSFDHGIRRKRRRFCMRSKKWCTQFARSVDMIGFTIRLMGNDCNVLWSI